MSFEILDETNTMNNLIWGRAYDLGYREPRFPLPALKLAVEACLEDWGVGDPTASHSIIIWHWELCPCCQQMHEVPVAVWEFNVHYAVEFFVPVGKYTNAREIELGRKAREFLLSGQEVGRA